MPTHDQLIGELDLHLFGEGTHRRLWELLGPQPVGRQPDGVWGTRFAVWAPNASAVAIVGDWNGWQADSLERVVSLERAATGSLLQVRNHHSGRPHHSQGGPDGSPDRAATE
jgi:hypothetical protein